MFTCCVLHANCKINTKNHTGIIFNKGLCRAQKYDTTTACRQTKVEQVYIQKASVDTVFFGVQILEFSFCWHLLVKFTSETIIDRGNPSTYYHKLSALSNQWNNCIKYWTLYTIKICQIWKLGHLLEIKQQNIFMVHQ